MSAPLSISYESFKCSRFIKALLNCRSAFGKCICWCCAWVAAHFPLRFPVYASGIPAHKNVFFLNREMNILTNFWDECLRTKCVLKKCSPPDNCCLSGMSASVINSRHSVLSYFFWNTLQILLKGRCTDCHVNQSGDTKHVNQLTHHAEHCWACGDTKVSLWPFVLNDDSISYLNVGGGA